MFAIWKFVKPCSSLDTFTSYNNVYMPDLGTSFGHLRL